MTAPTRASGGGSPGAAAPFGVEVGVDGLDRGARREAVAALAALMPSRSPSLRSVAMAT